MGTQPDDDGTPATGTPVLTGTPLIVLSLQGGRPYPATVQTWVATAQGLVVSARVSVTAEAMHSLADHRVWVSVPDRAGRLRCDGRRPLLLGLTAHAGPLVLLGLLVQYRGQARSTRRR